MAYSEKVLDHYANPKNVGTLDKSKQNVGTGLVGAPECGDVMRLQLEINDGIITDAKFKTFGCGSAIAASSLATEWLKGKTLDVSLRRCSSKPSFKYASCHFNLLSLVGLLIDKGKNPNWSTTFISVRRGNTCEYSAIIKKG